MTNKLSFSNFTRSLAVILMLLSFGCSDNPVNNNPPDNESETITTVRLRFVNSADSTQVFTVQWRDLDGEGGNPPVIGTLTLPANQTFQGSVTVLDESKSPIEDITEEIEEEADEHQLFYIVSGATLTFSYLDFDDDGKPLGLKTTVTSGAPSTGTLRVILKHEATKNTTISIPSTDGETDFDVVFPVNIQ